MRAVKLSTPWTCQKCQLPHGPCRGHNRAGKPCGRNGIAPGAIVCHMHGGKAPQVIEHAARRAAQMHVADLVRLQEIERGNPEPEHPLELLLERAHQAKRTCRVLDELVGTLQLDQIIENRKLDEEGRVLVSYPHVLLTMLREWTSEASKLSKMCLDAGIDERRLQLEQEQTDLLTGAVQRALGTVDLTEEQRIVLITALGAELRALTG